MARGITYQVERHMKGMTIAAIANRTVAHAVEAYRDAGIDTPVEVHTPDELDAHVRADRHVVTADPTVLARSTSLEGIVDATIDIEHSTRAAVAAIEGGKPLVTMNADMDATVGPLLKVRADAAGVTYSGPDGDQPGSIMNLYRFVETIGYRPVLAGNIKGFRDARRTPETQKEFAAKHGLSPQAATAFADGTKIAMEQTVVANATGFRVGRRGMYGPERAHVMDAVDAFPVDEMLEHGLVDYLLGAQPSPGVFVIGYSEDPTRQRYMRYCKMGDGPLYVFHTPFHLAHLEAPITAARGILLQDVSIAPRGGPQCDVLAVAKRNLEPGDVLDGIGGFMTHGEIDNSDAIADEGLLLMGLAEGSRVVRPVPQGRPIELEDVDLDEARITVQLRREQDELFG
jgi:predicted homoserine dehydrogenase-like protein